MSMGDGAAPEAASLQAVEWLVRLQAGDGASDVEQAWRAWRDSDPENEQAWQHIEACMARMRGLPASLAHGTLARKPAHAKAHAARRQSLKLLVLLAAGGGAWLAGGDEQARSWLADYRTGTGELRHIVLGDGTRIAMNTASSVDVRFDAGQRMVTVLQGEIMVTTARDAAGRPFFVQTAQGRLQPVGTRFAVRQHDGSSMVDVFESAVDIRPRDGGDAPLRLAAGRGVAFSRHAPDTPHAVDAHADAWARGQLIVDDVTLGDFLADLARYRPGVIHCAPAVAQLRLSGVFPLADTQGILTMLPNSLPVQVRSRTRYWVSVEPAP